MNKGYNRWEKFYHRLGMVFHGIIALSMIPFAWAFLETQGEFPDPPIVEGISLFTIKIIGSALCILIILFSYQYGHNLLAAARSREKTGDKLKAYLNEKTKDYLLLELGAIIAFVGLYLTKDHIFSLIYVAVLMMFSTKRPTYNRITKSLGISDEEIDEWVREEKKQG